MSRRDDATFPALEAPIPFGIAQILGAGGSLLSGFLGSNAASGAAQTQADAANQASLFEQAAFNQAGGGLSAASDTAIGGLSAASDTAIGGLNAATANAQNPEIAGNQYLQDMLAPYLSTGGTANAALQQLLYGGGVGYGGLGAIMQNPNLTFGNAPTYQPLTAQSFQSSPGYNFQLQQGVEAAQNAGAARTGGLSGNVLKAITGYGTGLANQDWYNANNLNLSNFNASQLQPWQQNVGLLQNTNANAFNMLSGLANSGKGVAGTLGGSEVNLGNLLGGQAINTGTQTGQWGLNTANQIGNWGINTANQIGNWGINTANQIGGNTIGAGNALAAGQIGSANALAGGFGGASTALLGGAGGGGGGGGLNGLLASIFGGGAGGGGGDFGGFMA